MIEVHELTKRYGETLAVDGLSFQVPQGVVTGFLGPNGAGKSTTMRMMLDLDRPTSGRVTIDGKHYHQLNEPLKYIGALLEAKAVHPGRTAYNHLLWLAQSNRIPASRVDEVLGLVVQPTGDGAFEVRDGDPAVIGDLARDRGIALHELSPQRASLEEAFLQMTADSVEYRTGPGPKKES